MYSALLKSEGQNAVDRESTVQVIQLDIERTFPQLCIFQKVRASRALLTRSS